MSSGSLKSAVCIMTVVMVSSGVSGDELFDAQKSRFEQMAEELIARGNLAEDIGEKQQVTRDSSPDGHQALPKTVATIGSASITYPPYGFEWKIVPYGWYWESSDEILPSFYSFTQGFKDFDVFSAFLVTEIHLNSTAYQAAEIDMELAQSYDATMYETMTSTTFNGYPAYHNAYAYSTDLDISVDSWFFDVNGTVYAFVIFTTVQDWNENNALYLMMRSLLQFPGTTLAKTRPSQTHGKPVIQYYPAPDGSVSFSYVPHNSELFVYDLRGKLIRQLSGSTWDGLDHTGKRVSSGFYVTNIKMPQMEENVRFYKR